MRSTEIGRLQTGARRSPHHDDAPPRLVVVTERFDGHGVGSESFPVLLRRRARRKLGEAEARRRLIERGRSAGRASLGPPWRARRRIRLGPRSGPWLERRGRDGTHARTRMPKTRFNLF